jgi:hypothetical protein
MLLKRTIRFVSVVLAFFGFVAVEGCGKDDDDDLCYVCTYTDYGQTYKDTYCFSDYKDYLTREEFKSYYENDPDCKRKK